MLKSHQIPLALPVKNTDASCFMLSSHFLWILNMKICSMIKTSTYPLSSENVFQTMKGRVIFPGPAGVFICWGTHTQNHNFIEQEHNYSQLSHFIDEEIEIAGNCHNCSHMCRPQTCQSSHHLRFHPTQLGLNCSTMLFSVHHWQKGLFWLLGKVKSLSNGALA